MDNQRGRVVVGIDGSAGSRAALVHPMRDVARRGAALEGVSAFAAESALWNAAPAVS